jgi:hypothetical protein
MAPPPVPSAVFCSRIWLRTCANSNPAGYDNAWYHRRSGTRSNFWPVGAHQASRLRNRMEYLIGIGLGAAVAGLATGGWLRPRSFFRPNDTPCDRLMFAAIGDTARPLVAECVVASGFLLVGVIAFKSNLWLIPAGMVAHGVFDFFHGSLIHNSGVPSWWPGFCLAFDAIFGGWLAVVLLRRSRPALSGASLHQGCDAR